MGHGTGKGLIIDESCELDDVTYTKAFRMLGDKKDSVLIELANPWSVIIFISLLTIQIIIR